METLSTLSQSEEPAWGQRVEEHYETPDDVSIDAVFEYPISYEYDNMLYD